MRNLLRRETVNRTCTFQPASKQLLCQLKKGSSVDKERTKQSFLISLLVYSPTFPCPILLLTHPHTHPPCTHLYDMHTRIHYRDTHIPITFNSIYILVSSLSSLLSSPPPPPPSLPLPTHPSPFHSSLTLNNNPSILSIYLSISLL